MKDLIIFGDTSFAEIAGYYFHDDTEHNLIGFCVDDEFHNRETLLGYPVFSYSAFLSKYKAANFHVFVSITYKKLNLHRERILKRCLEDGFQATSYVSPEAKVHRSVEIGYHNFIFENNVVQPGCRLGSNNVVWSGNHIGHHSTFGDNNFISSHCVFAGHVSIGNNCFFGVNSAVSNNLAIDDFVWVEPSSLISRDLGRGAVVRSTDSEVSKVSSFRLFKVTDDFNS